MKRGLQNIETSYNRRKLSVGKIRLFILRKCLPRDCEVSRSNKLGVAGLSPLTGGSKHVIGKSWHLFEFFISPGLL